MYSRDILVGGISSPKSGVVKEILVSEGASVKKGDALMNIE
ncbi:MAG: biotin/lipoyl-binding protein [Methanosarcinales archaeon]